MADSSEVFVVPENYARPLKIFRIIALEYKDISDEDVCTFIELAEPFISKKIFGRFYDQALAYLTAHHMKMQGYGDTSLGTIGNSLNIASYSEGETSVSFNTGQSTNLLEDGDLTLTTYGLMYLDIRRLVIVPIRSAGEAPLPPER